MFVIKIKVLHYLIMQCEGLFFLTEKENKTKVRGVTNGCDGSCAVIHNILWIYCSRH